MFRHPLARGTGTPQCWLGLEPQSGARFCTSELVVELLRLAGAGQPEAARIIYDLSSTTTLLNLMEALSVCADLVAFAEAHAKAPAPPMSLPAPREIQLWTHGTLTCNMACRYCNSRHARARSNPHEAPRLMPLATAARAIRFGTRRVARGGRVYVNFTLGGEPLLALDRYEDLAAYCASVSQETGTPLTLNLNTNGSALTEEFLQHCEANGVLMSLSLDGPKDIHDSMRLLASGEGSYESIVRWLPRIRSSQCTGLRAMAVGAVLTARNPDPKRVYQHLIELGFPHVVVTPVRDDPAMDWSLSADTVASFKRGYTEYAEWMLDCLDTGDDRIYAALIAHDYFGRLVIEMVRGGRAQYRCTAARSIFGIAFDGGIYPCDSFIQSDRHRLGDVRSGLDREAHAEFLRGTCVDENPVCRDCWARYLCGGGCYFQSVLGTGNHTMPYWPQCELLRHCIELVAGILFELQRRNPVAHERLCRAVLSSTSPAVMPVPANRDVALPQIPGGQRNGDA